MSMPGGAPPRPDPTGSGRASASRQPVADLRTDGSPVRNQLAGPEVCYTRARRQIAVIAERMEDVRLIQSMCARLPIHRALRSAVWAVSEMPASVFEADVQGTEATQ